MNELSDFNDRKFMYFQHIKPLRELISQVCKSISECIDYLELQNERTNTAQQKEQDSFDKTIEAFSVTSVKQYVGTMSPLFDHFKKLQLALDNADVYSPVELRHHLTYSSRRKFRYLLSSLKERGIPYIFKDFNIYHYSLPSKGSHEAVHFIWKQPQNEGRPDTTSEQRIMIHEIQNREEKYYNHGTRRELKKKMMMLSVISARNAEFLMREILGDKSAPTNQDERSSLVRLDQFMNTGDDIVIDLRKNNGRAPKYEEFWEFMVLSRIKQLSTIDGIVTVMGKASLL